MEDQKKRPAVAAEGEGETRKEELERMNEEAFAAMVDANFRESEGVRLDGSFCDSLGLKEEEAKAATERFLNRVRERCEQKGKATGWIDRALPRHRQSHGGAMGMK
jgi:hypothetical protein